MRWLGRAFLGLILIAAVVLPALWLARDTLAPRAVRFAVNTWAGTPVIDSLAFRIDGLSPESLDLAAVNLNGPDGLSATRVEVSYDWRRLLRGEVEAIAFLHPVLSVDIGSDGTVTMGALEPLRALGPGRTDEKGPGFPDIRFSDAAVQLSGWASGRATGTGAVWRSGEEIRATADGRVALVGADWRADALGAVQASLSPSLSTLQATLNDGDARQGTLSVAGLRGAASIALPAADAPTVSADLTAGQARAEGLEIADPAIQLRYDAFGVSTVLRLGDPQAPAIRVAIETSADGDGGRRPLSVDLRAELDTVDRLAAAARRAEPLGLTGNLSGTLRGTVPERLEDPRTLWDQAVAAGGITVEATSPAARGTARLAAALALGRLAVETVEPATATVDAGSLAALTGFQVGDPVIEVTVGDPTRSLGILLEDLFELPRITIAGPVRATGADGAQASLTARATLELTAEGVSVTGLDGTARVKDLSLADGRVHDLDVTIGSLVADRNSASARGQLTGRLDLAGFEDVSIEMPLRAERRNGVSSLYLTGPGRVLVPDVPASDAALVDTPITVILQPVDRPAVLYRPTAESPLAAELAFQIPALGLTTGGSQPVRVDATLISGSLRSALANGAGPLTVSLDAGTVAIEPRSEEENQGPSGLAISELTLNAESRIEDASVAFERLSLTATEVADRARAPRFTPLRGQGDVWRRTRPGLGFRGTLRGADGAFVLDAEGSHNLATGEGLAEINLFPLVFVPGGLQPGDLSPAATALFRQTTGKIALAGTVAWPGTAVAPHNPLTLAVEKLSFTGSLGTVSEMTGAVAISGVDPLATPPDQEFRATGIDIGLPIAEPRIAFGLTDPGTLTLNRIEARFADGTVTASDIQVPLASEAPVAVRLQVADIDAARLVEVTDLEGLTASGSLSGELPLVWDPASGLSLEEARLAATTPGGTVRYRPTEPPAALRDAGEEVSLLLQAVRNLVYEQFEIEANGRPGETFDVKLRVRGANPDLFDGYPVALNVSLSGRLDELFLSARQTLGLSDVLKRKLEAGDPSG